MLELLEPRVVALKGRCQQGRAPGPPRRHCGPSSYPPAGPVPSTGYLLLLMWVVRAVHLAWSARLTGPTGPMRPLH